MSIVVLKMGGAALKDKKCIQEISSSVVYLKSKGYQVVIVHGGGPMINHKLIEKGIQWNFHEGQRITTYPMIECIEEAFLEVNQMIMSDLFRVGVNPVAYPGFKNNLLLCEQLSVELGQVGVVTEVNAYSIHQYLNLGLTPVIAPMGVGLHGEKYNINADWAAAKIAHAVCAKHLMYCTDQIGILDSDGLPYDNLTSDQIQILIDKEGVTGGMLVKAQTILFSLKNQVKHVFVLHANDLMNLVMNEKCGTNCAAQGHADYCASLQVG